MPLRRAVNVPALWLGQILLWCAPQAHYISIDMIQGLHCSISSYELTVHSVLLTVTDLPHYLLDNSNLTHK